MVRKNITVGYHPPASHRRLRWIAVAVGLTVVIGLLGGSFALGRAITAEADSPANTSARSPMQRGVPVPDRHTSAGAATAAANFQIAGFRVSAGSLDANAAADVLLAPDAERGARTVLSAPTADPAQLRQARTSFAPLSTVVIDYNPARATVQVWGVSATSSQLTPQPGGTETWGRSTISMLWDGSQWRVQNQEYSRGPWPVRSDERLTDTDGDFGFRFRELTQHGWTRVVRFADDFVVLSDGNQSDVETLREDIATVLRPLGLRLSPAKTRIVHMADGFDFLGFRIQWRRKRGTNKWTSTPSSPTGPSSR